MIDKNKEIQALFMMINDLFYKNFLSVNRDAIESLYELSKTHLELKIFELSLTEKEKTIVRKAMETLINKHLSIFYRVHCLNEDMVEVVSDVLELTIEELKKLM